MWPSFGWTKRLPKSCRSHTWQIHHVTWWWKLLKLRFLFIGYCWCYSTSDYREKSIAIIHGDWWLVSLCLKVNLLYIYFLWGSSSLLRKMIKMSDCYETLNNAEGNYYKSGNVHRTKVLIKVTFCAKVVAQSLTRDEGFIPPFVRNFCRRNCWIFPYIFCLEDKKYIPPLNYNCYPKLLQSGSTFQNDA